MRAEREPASEEPAELPGGEGQPAGRPPPAGLQPRLHHLLPRPPLQGPRTDQQEPEEGAPETLQDPQVRKSEDNNL